MRIAVVGSGVAGLSAAWLLSRQHEVVLYEAADRLGGHAHTVDVTVDGLTAPVDTGFLVFNHQTYPELTSLFDHLGIATTASDMSFSVRIDNERVAWSGTNLAALFAQPRNLFRRGFWRMLQDVPRFNRMATEAAVAGDGEGVTLGDYLLQHRFSREFRDWYLLPMAGAIWSCPTREMLDYPLSSFVRFCANHGLLQVTDRPQWRTVVGGSREYVNRMAGALADVRLSEPVQRISRTADGVTVTSPRGEVRFDQLVMACHTDQGLRMLADADADERSLLESVPYQPNVAVLHTDPSFMPRERRAWSSWNYHADSAADGDRPVGVSYWINRLQPLPFERPVILTLNPEREVPAEHRLGEYRYDHPVFDFTAIGAQRRLASVQGRRRVWFCGAWTGYGFHEDGLRSALDVAGALGVMAPWHSVRRAA